MPEITPKGLVLKDPAFVKDHRDLVVSEHMHKASTAVLAELARQNLSSEVMRGANLFLDTFTNLAEEQAKPSVAFPHKHLIETFSQPEIKK